MRGGKVTIGGDDSRPPLEATVEPFYIGKFPVSNEQFEAFDPGFERSAVSPDDRDPAAGVSFEMALAYCQWYAGVSRKPMRLPSEVEWEYACRGEGADHADGDDSPAGDFMWHAGNSDGRIGRLDAKKANAFGLYGMLGGVWEWTSTLYGPTPSVEPSGDGDSLPGQRVLRGGSLHLDAAEISCSLRRGEDSAACPGDVGFRIVKSFR